MADCGQRNALFCLSTALCLHLQRILPAAQHSLWLLVLRGIGIEFRMQIENHVWRSLSDGSFGSSSALLAIFFGAALGNMVRGVPLKADHFFFEPLWTNFRTGAHTGILDWYTCGTAVLALVALVVHGVVQQRVENPRGPSRLRDQEIPLYQVR